MLIESRADFSQILEVSAISLRQVQRAETLLAIAFSPRVTDDRTFKGLPRLDFQPGIASFPGEVGAVALFGHDAFKTRLLDGFEEGRPLFDNFTHAIRGLSFNRISEPFAPPCQRLIHNRASVEIKTIEDIAHGRMFGAGTFDSGLRLLLHAMNHVSEIRISIRVQADNFSVKQCRGGAEGLFGNQQLRKLFCEIHPVAPVNSDFPFIQGNESAETVPLDFVNIILGSGWF